METEILEEEDLDVVDELYFWSELIAKSRGKANVVFIEDQIFVNAAQTIQRLRLANMQTLILLSKFFQAIQSHHAQDHDNPKWFETKKHLTEKYDQYIQTTESEYSINYINDLQILIQDLKDQSIVRNSLLESKAAEELEKLIKPYIE